MQLQPQDVKLIVCETLTALGWDVREPQQAQADMAYLRKMRKGSEAMTTRMKLSIAGAMLSTGLYLLWLGIKATLKGDL